MISEVMKDADERMHKQLKHYVESMRRFVQVVQIRVSWTR